jgi:hypothetical protein
MYVVSKYWSWAGAHIYNRQWLAVSELSDVASTVLPLASLLFLMAKAVI